MRTIIVSLAICLHVSSTFGQETELSADQKLVVACHQLDLPTVVKLLRSGADVNARFGDADIKKHFQDAWLGGWPMTASQWTPIQALANSSTYPPPKKKYENTVEHLDWAQATQKKIPADQITIRSERRVQILNILLSHGCDIDATDDRGASALYNAVYSKHEKMALTLLEYKPDVNTKTGIYIGGTFNTTPLHRAYWSPILTKRLIQLGADDNAKDSAGNTPKEWRDR